MDIVIAQSSSILKLFACEDQTLLIGRNALFVLDLGLDVVDCIAGFDFEGDGFAREGLNEAVCFDTRPSVFRMPEMNFDAVGFGGWEVTFLCGWGVETYICTVGGGSMLAAIAYYGIGDLNEEPTLADFVAPLGCKWRYVGLCKYCTSILGVGLR